MLDPNARSLYTGALRPPPGHVFDTGLAATYSLDLATLLSVPLHLALFSAEQDSGVPADAIGLLESLRRTASRLSVYCQQGRIHAPLSDHVLYGALEPVIVQARAPLGGSFHPKLWVLRFVGDGGEPLVRLMVLSRNMTRDRSWDLSLVLEGRPGGRRRAENRELAELVRALPGLARRGVPDGPTRQAEAISEELRRVAWQKPEGFEEVRFHVLGLRPRRWSLPSSKRLAVISPFCADEALVRLADTSREPAALISRAEDLAALSETTRARFARCLVLDEAVETEDAASDGDADVRSADGVAPVLRGLHAKAYVAEVGWYTHVFVGSANATRAALLGRINVELVAELVGKRSAVGGVDDLLGDGGLREILAPFAPPEGPPPEGDEERRRAERLREAVADADLSLRCEREGDAWRLTLESAHHFELDEGAGLRAWPVTLPEDGAVVADPLARGEPVRLAPCALASVTGLVAFRLDSPGENPLRFVLNLPVDGLPEGRESAWLRAVVSDRAGFLRYLLLLLAQEDPSSGSTGLPPMPAGGGGNGAGRGPSGPPLIEQLTRTLSRDPERLSAVGRVVRELAATDGDEEVLPPGFVELWRVFERALKGGSG